MVTRIISVYRIWMYISEPCIIRHSLCVCIVSQLELPGCKHRVSEGAREADPRQVWIGNIPACLSEEELIGILEQHHVRPYKVVLRRRGGDQVLQHQVSTYQLLTHVNICVPMWRCTYTDKHISTCIICIYTNVCIY